MENIAEEKKHSPEQSKSTKSAAVIGGCLLVVIVTIGAFYLFITRNQIYTDKADIEAPLISIAPIQGGTLQKILVESGQQIEAGTPVAQVANQILHSEERALVVEAKSNEGKTVGAGESVVTVIHPVDLRVVAHIDEDKGLGVIKIGQLVNFTVDTFGSNKYTGIVDEVSPTSRQSGVVFNISDQREIRQFDVKIKFDVQKYSELKNGMSAKVTIFKN